MTYLTSIVILLLKNQCYSQLHVAHLGRVAREYMRKVGLSYERNFETQQASTRLGPFFLRFDSFEATFQ